MGYVRGMFVLMLFVACVGDKAPDSLGGDTSGDTSPDTAADGGVWEPVIPACDLVAPLPVAAGAIPTLYKLYGPDPIHMASLAGYIDTYADDLGCPIRTEDVDAGTVVYEGSCSSDELTFEGRWTSFREVGSDGGGRDAELAEGVRFVENYLAGFVVTADGSVSSQGTAEGWSVERDYALDLQLDDPWVDGTWYARSSESGTYAGENTIHEMYVDAIPDVGDAGDYCLTLDSRPVPDCELEPWGGWVLQGASVVVVTFDPDVACDGCADVTIDGADAGEVCGSLYGATYIRD
ncbi:MAG: hypothetical protein Q8P18_05645 [Pseudomonadota bacterium]|nr:hypothetical protein [Pseudomonadota bacterium]